MGTERAAAYRGSGTLVQLEVMAASFLKHLRSDFLGLRENMAFPISLYIRLFLDDLIFQESHSLFPSGP